MGRAETVRGPEPLYACALSERHAEWDVREPVRRAGAGVAVALAAAASMSARIARTRLMTFINGDREPERVRILLLSTRAKCSAN